MNYQNFNDDDSYRSEKDFPNQNRDNGFDQDSRQWGSEILKPSNNRNSAGLKADFSHASKSKRILDLSIQMGLNIPVILHLLNNQDLSLPEDQILNNILDEYNKHISKMMPEEQGSILQRSERILRNFDSELRMSNVNSQRNRSIMPSTRITIHKNKPSKTLNFLCPICYDEYSQESEVFHLLCGHATCRDCFNNYIKNKILIAQVKNFKCPQEACKFQIPESEIVRFLKPNPDLFQKYKKFKNAQEIAANPNLKWCIRPGCENVVQITDPSNPFIKCSCGQEFCFKCNNPWHPSMRCEDFIDKIYKSYIKSAEVKFCPKCRSLIEKNDGCNHMTCIQCNYQFCWICEKEYTANHYSLLNLNGCPGLQFTNISKNASIWRRRCHWIKSLLLTLLVILVILTIGPIVGFFFAITFPLQRYFFVNGGYSCSNCQNAWVSVFKFIGLLVLGILLSPIIMVGFLCVFVLVRR